MKDPFFLNQLFISLPNPSEQTIKELKIYFLSFCGMAQPKLNKMLLENSIVRAVYEW